MDDLSLVNRLLPFYDLLGDGFFSENELSLKNQNGVVMNLTSTQSGIKFKLAPEGLKLELE